MTREPQIDEREPPREPWTSFLLPIARIFGLVLLLSLNVDVGGVGAEAVESNSLEAWLKLIVGYFAAVVISVAILRGILSLGAIVLLRTLLNYFLEREIRQAKAGPAA